MLEIDGALGEGGGQVLRSALALSLLTQTPFRLINIRARRPEAGAEGAAPQGGRGGGGGRGRARRRGRARIVAAAVRTAPHPLR